MVYKRLFPSYSKFLRGRYQRGVENFVVIAPNLNRIEIIKFQEITFPNIQITELLSNTIIEYHLNIIIMKKLFYPRQNNYFIINTLLHAYLN
jgi:hypothetical protein